MKNVTASDVKRTIKREHYAVDLLEERENIGRCATCRPNGNTKAVRAFPRLSFGVNCSMPSKQYLAAAHPTGGHVTRLEHHRRPPHVLLGAVVHQHVHTYLTKLLVVLSTVSLLWWRTLHPESHGERGAA